jgi:hypothetical protein
VSGVEVWIRALFHVANVVDRQILTKDKIVALSDKNQPKIKLQLIVNQFFKRKNRF